MHLELLGTTRRVAQAKAEILGGIEPGGIGIIPTGEPLLEPFIPAGLDLRRGHGRSRAVFEIEGEHVELELPLSARHQAENTLAALTVYHALGLPLERAQEGAGEINLSRCSSGMLLVGMPMTVPSRLPAL